MDKGKKKPSPLQGYYDILNSPEHRAKITKINKERIAVPERWFRKHLN